MRRSRFVAQSVRNLPVRGRQPRRPLPRSATIASHTQLRQNFRKAITQLLDKAVASDSDPFVAFRPTCMLLDIPDVLVMLLQARLQP